MGSWREDFQRGRAAATFILGLVPPMPPIPPVPDHSETAAPVEPIAPVIAGLTDDEISEGFDLFADDPAELPESPPKGPPNNAEVEEQRAIIVELTEKIEQLQAYTDSLEAKTDEDTQLMIKVLLLPGVRSMLAKKGPPDKFREPR